MTNFAPMKKYKTSDTLTEGDIVEYEHNKTWNDESTAYFKAVCIDKTKPCMKQMRHGWREMAQALRGILLQMGERGQLRVRTSRGRPEECDRHADIPSETWQGILKH